MLTEPAKLPNMRLFLTLLLAIAIPFNAAFAAAAALCDTEASHATHSWHMGHHDHGHDHGSSGNSKDTQSTGDGHHTHAHPTFSSVLSVSLDYKVMAGNDVRHAEPVGGLVSAPPSRLERPPRNILVA